MPADLRQKFKDLTLALKDLHRELLQLQARQLETEMDRKPTPYELLHASLNNPSFNWLRYMSELIVQIDTVIDETKNLSGQEASRVADEVLTLLEKPAAKGPVEFWNEYTKHLSQNPDVIMKHSRVKEICESLRPSM